MVRLVLLISLVILTGCKKGSMFSSKPRYSVGDCVASTSGLERWEKPSAETISKVAEIGNEKYRVLYATPWGIVSTGMYFSILEGGTEKITCPKELQEPGPVVKENE